MLSLKTRNVCYLAGIATDCHRQVLTRAQGRARMQVRRLDTIKTVHTTVLLVLHPAGTKRRKESVARHSVEDHVSSGVAQLRVTLPP